MTRSSSWLLGTTVRRTRAQWRLLAAVVAVAVLASALVTSLGLLVTATEQGGVRGALSSIPASQSTLGVRLLRPTAPVAAARKSMAAAAAAVLGRAATSTSSGMALTGFESAPGLGTLPALAYFGELDDIRSHATLTAGEWAGEGVVGAPTPVTIPVAAATALALRVGSIFTVDNSGVTVSAVVTGLYRANHPSNKYWARDFLNGKGNDPAFPKPGVMYYSPTNAFGPLIAAPGALDTVDIPLSFIDVEFYPRFNDTTVDELAPLQARLASADLDVARRVGNVASGVFYTSDAAEAVNGVAAGLAVTRSTVVVVSLLLLVLAIVAMGQTARLFTDARAGERQLLRSRGASGGHIFALATFEAALIGVIVAGVSPPLALLAYRLLAVQPPMRAAGMPLDSGIPPGTWATAAALALVFVVVLVAPLLGRARTFAEGEASKGRQRFASGLMRSGLDVAIVLLAALAFWQLQSYRTPLDSSASLAVDPVLAAGPALVLLAGTLVCVRLIPAASRLIERLGARARGIDVPLAAWEIGRRSGRATAAVLLLSLTLAVGTFGLSFLSTWKQSQVDQATVAIGAPARVQSQAAIADYQAEALHAGAVGKPQPVIRVVGLVASADASSEDVASGSPAQILGLSRGATALIDRDRLAELGGSQIRQLLSRAVKPSSGFELPGAVRGVAATIQIGEAESPVAGIYADVNAIIEDGNGLISTVGLGQVDADGLPHAVRGLVPQPPRGASMAGPVRFVGFQATYLNVNPQDPGKRVVGTPADILVKDIAAVHAPSPSDATDKGDSGAGNTGIDYPTVPAVAPAKGSWFGQTSELYAQVPLTNEVPKGWQLRLDTTIPTDVQSQTSNYSLVGWTPVTGIAAVVSESLANSLRLYDNVPLTLQIQSAKVMVTVAGTAPLVPGAATTVDLGATGSGLTSGASQTDTVVVDQTQLSRALAQAGIAGPMVDEWWVDVAAGHGQAYLDAHKAPAGVAPTRSAEVLGVWLQQAPLRVATQAALWLAILASALLAAVGFAVHSTATLRARRLEFAQLRAIGFSRRRLVGLIASESFLICALGTIFGLAIGVLLAWLVGPLVAVSPGGTPPVPSVVVMVPWGEILLLVVEVVAVLALVVITVARVQRFAEPAELLREGSAQ